MKITLFNLMLLNSMYKAEISQKNKNTEIKASLVKKGYTFKIHLFYTK